MSVNKYMFREYDIRGIFDQDLTLPVAALIGKAVGTILRQKGIKEVIVGYDNRNSSPALGKSLIRGLLTTGVSIFNIGLVTTPMCYCACDILKLKARIMITASHNPKEYNGFKISYNGHYNIAGEEVTNIYNVIQNGNFTVGEGSIQTIDIKQKYFGMILNDLKMGNRPLRIAYDCGNGTTSIIIKEILNNFNFDFIGLYDKSDPNFPNHHPDPSKEENLAVLKQTVIDRKCDIGIAFDGDGDRVGIIDEKGRFLFMDQIMMIIIKNIYKNIRKNKGVLYDVKCSKALTMEIEKLGLIPNIWRTGNSYTRKGMYDNNFIFGGELSGHIYFQDRTYPGYDDGIYNALRIIELLSTTKDKISDFLLNTEPFYNIPENEYSVSDQNKFKVMEKIKKYCQAKYDNILDIDGVRIDYDDGFALVRASNTSPKVLTRFEATSLERLNEIFNEYDMIIKKAIKEVGE